MASSNVHTVLPNGRKMPLLGFGTWQLNPKEAYSVIETAITCGYRHVDDAALYGNEKEVGDAIRAKVEDKTITREELFVTSKLWMTSTHRVEESCRESLRDLGLDYLDLYLMHTPMAAVSGKGMWPADDNGMLIPDDSVDFVDTWKAMENLVDKGLVRAIGVSNFNLAQIQRILDLPPKHQIANLQIECHPFLAQTELVDFCKKHGITVTAYGSLGSPGRILMERFTSDPTPMQDPVVCEIAKRRGVSPAQVLIRYQIQRGVATVPKSVNSSRIQANFEALNFELKQEDCQALDGLNKDYRLFNFAPMRNLKYFPF